MIWVTTRISLLPSYLQLTRDSTDLLQSRDSDQLFNFRLPEVARNIDAPESD